MTTLSLEELCDAANERLSELELQAPDGRTNPQVTARNVRFYQSKSLLSTVGRIGGRAAYTNAHIDEIVAIKRAQADGLTLDEIASRQSVATPTKKTTIPIDVTRLVTHEAVEPFAPTASGSLFPLLNTLNLKFTEPLDVHTSRNPKTDFVQPRESVPVSGWFLDLPGGHRLSGPGTPPTRDVIDQIAKVLATRKQPEGDRVPAQE